MARHRFLVTTSGGSNPSTPNKYFLLHKFSIFIVLLTMRSLGGMVDTVDLKSILCWFESNSEQFF